MRGPGRLLVRLFQWAGFCLACLLVAVGLLLFVLEQSGWLADWARARGRAQLASSGTEFELEGVELDWFQPAVRLRGISLGAQGRLLRLESATLVLDPFAVFESKSQPTSAVGRVRLEGGRVRLCQELLDALALLGGRTPAHGGAPEGAPALEEVASIPPIEVRGLQLDLVHPEYGDIPLGRLEASFAQDPEAGADLRGMLAPSLAQPEDAAARVFLSGRLLGPRRLRVALSTAALPLSTQALPARTPLERLREFDPRGTLTLSGEAELSFDPALPSSLKLRALLSDGSLTRAATGLALRNLELDLEASCAPEAGGPWSSPLAWNARARCSATWHDGPLELFARFGRAAGAGRTFSAEARAPLLRVSPELLAELGVWSEVAAEYQAVDPRGVADLAAACALGADGRWSGAADVELKGGLSACYHGWPTGTARKPEGFPLPLDAIHGRVCASYDDAAPRPFHLGLMDLRGSPLDEGGGKASAGVSGVIAASERGSAGDGWPEFRLEFQAQDLSAGPAVRRAVEGLIGTEWIWPAFRPTLGTAAGKGLLVSDPHSDGVSGHFEIRPRGLQLSWEGLPVPVEQLSGRIDLHVDPRLLFGVTFDVEGSTPTAEKVRVRGRVQQDPGLARPVPPLPVPASPPRSSAEEELELLMDFDVAVGGMALRGSDREVVAAAWPGVGTALDLFQPSGKADIDARVTRPLPGDPLAFRIEIEPRQVQITPTSFSTPTRNVAGRVLVLGLEGGRAAKSEFTTRIAPLVGDWPQDARVACSATFPGGGVDHLEVLGAGVDITNRGLVGAFREAFGGESGAGGFDLRALSIDGRIDFAADMRLTPVTGAKASNDGVYRVYLRDNAFRTEAFQPGAPERREGYAGFGLSGLWGELVQRDGVLTGERVRAVLGSTPVELEQARFAEEGGLVRFTTGVRARGVPLDEQHLSLFLDSDTVRAALDRLHLSGWIDFENARLEYSGRSEKQNPKLVLSGDIRPRDAFVDLGMPLSIDRARVDLSELVLEGGHVRAWARVFELDGSIARRKLEAARMLVTYVEPRLSLLDLSGSLEGGRISDLASVDGPDGRARTTASGPAFTMDLLEPYRFELGLALRDVQVRGLLRGMFQSEFADTGLLDSEIRLEGSLEHLTGIQGDGFVHMRDTRLWSIPVMRDLLSQLGLDSSAVFERMQSRFSLSGGVIRMDAIHVASPLLQLVGAGELDLDGRLRHDLQVRFGLVDRLGPVTRAWYWIQNNLLSVSVRGDMARPQVLFKGALSFFGSSERKKRELPLPSLSPLPARF
ncbi:MAG: hypothetical protein IPK67_13700 [Planctomycetes bacterium]|nr:hypothetical protein [Planctomycetota bacterium]